MKQNRSRNQDVPHRTSSIESKEDSRENMTGSESQKDRGSSSDRAMMSDRGSAEERTGAPGQERMRGLASDRDDRSHSGGITNRGRDREQREQEQLPQRGKEKRENTR